MSRSVKNDVVSQSRLMSSVSYNQFRFFRKKVVFLEQRRAFENDCRVTMILGTQRNIKAEFPFPRRDVFLQLFAFNMSTIFLFEDGHGNVVDENGGPEPMEYIVDQDEFVVEPIATHTEYLKNPTSVNLHQIAQCY